MLISFEEINKVLLSKNININGAFHIGAHDCEEIPFYNSLGLKNEDVIWIEAINSKVISAKEKNIPNVYNEVITDKDNENIEFNISNNLQCCSILELGTCLHRHPEVSYINKLSLKSITIDTFFKKYNLDASKYNFWNFDIQGAELLALKGSVESIKYAKAIYLEVNLEEIYKNGALIHEIDNFLSQFNFKRVLTNILQFNWGDALYIKDE